MCFTIVMESFDMFLSTNFVSLKHFSKTYGVRTGPVEWAIPTRWQSALFQAGQIGYRWTTLLGLVLMNATIIVSFFADSLTLLAVGQALEGVPGGFFMANSPAYASEATTTSTANGLSLSRSPCNGSSPLRRWCSSPLLPESPWWHIRRGRKEEAFRPIKRLGAKSSEEQAQQSLAMIERTVKIEESMGRAPTLLDLLKGTDRRRTIITCLAYASQNFAGNLIANQATYFFEQSGISSNKAFQLNLITTCLQFIANAGSWGLTSWFRRRTVFLYGTGANIVFFFILGVCASVPQNHKTNYAQACLDVIISFMYAGAQGPISYTIVSETSSVRLCALSTAVGRMLNTTGWNIAGKCGYVWGCTAPVCWVMAYFFLPELKHRSEADILFIRKASARKFKTTVIGVEENK
ncbi:major facilitator superfamily domain-containing protein [Aspergillus navahoensis]